MLVCAWKMWSNGGLGQNKWPTPNNRHRGEGGEEEEEKCPKSF